MRRYRLVPSRYFDGHWWADWTFDEMEIEDGRLLTVGEEYLCIAPPTGDISRVIA